MHLFKAALPTTKAAWRPAQALLRAPTPRLFSSDVSVKAEESAVDFESHQKRVGADMEFSSTKHGYVLSFPWNFPEIIDNYETQYSAVDGFWSMFVKNTCSEEEFNNLFR